MLGLQISRIIINLFKLQDSTYNMRDNNKLKITLVNTNANKFNIMDPFAGIIYQYI